MDFEEVLYRAQQGEQNFVEQILEMYRPTLIRNSLVDGRFDEELYQELMIESLKCIQRFKKLE